MLHVGCCKKDSALSVCQRCGWDVRLIVNINFKRKKPARKRFDQCSQGSQGFDVAGDHPDSHLSHGQLVRFVVAVTDSHTSSFQKYCAVHSERFITTRHKIMIKISQDLIQATDTYSPTGSVAGPVLHLYFVINVHLGQVLVGFVFVLVILHLLISVRQERP